MDNASQIVFGTCDGTGVAINVCLGFVPRYVKLFNLEDAGTKYPTIEWINPSMIAITAADEGMKDMDDTGVQRALLASAGVSPFTGGTKLTYLSATHPHWCVVGATTDVSEAYVDGHYHRVAVGDTAFKSIGDSLLGKTPTAADYGAIVTATPGFTIGTDADMNQDGEQILWMVVQ